MHFICVGNRLTKEKSDVNNLIFTLSGIFRIMKTEPASLTKIYSLIYLSHFLPVIKVNLLVLTLKLGLGCSHNEKLSVLLLGPNILLEFQFYFVKNILVFLPNCPSLINIS
jgi:hypothetical protein